MIGVDYHPSFQQIAFLVEETGEYSERRLNHSDGEAEKYYRDPKLRGVQVRVGMENIQPDVIHTLQGGASFGVSESARSLSSAFVHQVLLHQLIHSNLSS
jgi:hypothetical protein